MILRRRCNGAKYDAEASDPYYVRVVGERSLREEGKAVRRTGLQRSDYADISNDKTGEKPVRRKPEDSWVKLICPGLVGP